MTMRDRTLLTRVLVDLRPVKLRKHFWHMRLGGKVRIRKGGKKKKIKNNNRHLITRK